MEALTISSGRPLRGEITVPGDKSISHRALLFGALARGVTRATGFLPSDDCLSTAACLRQLGVRVRQVSETEVTVEGFGLRGLAEAADVLNCGNSGTTMRLLSGILAGQPFYSVLTGDESLRRRPMARVADPLRAMGATVSGRQGGKLPPLTILGGPLRGMDHVLPVASAQVKSCLVLAGLFADGATTVTEPSASRDHTERLLAAQGVIIVSRPAPDGSGDPSQPGARLIRVEPPSRPLEPLDIQVPGDISSAAFFLVAAAITARSQLTIRGMGVNPTRTGILDALAAMGATVALENPRDAGGEPVADLVVKSCALRGTEIGGAMIPRLIDELPVLAVAATQANGTTTVRDAAELRVKESDRITAVVRELRKLGARIRELPDGFVVEGPTTLCGNVVDAGGDHRLAMSLAVAGLVAHGQTTILGAESVSVSFPGFQRLLARCRGEVGR
jgi:3-phosphoshikimate 1-carboxyvinyltransferase